VESPAVEPPVVESPVGEEREAADGPAAGASAVQAADEADDPASGTGAVPDGAGEVRVPDSAVGNGISTTGDKADVSKGFSSYSPVGHYGPEVVEEETQRG
jgi:hypothetical protein